VKRFLKIAFIIPIMFVTMLFAFACGEVNMQSISLSISDEYAFYYNGYYYVDKSNNSIPIETVITPSEFDVKDLTWKSSNTNVAKVYYNSFKTVGTGETTITATYKNSDGKQVSALLRLSVNETNPDITFNSNSLQSTYLGTDQKQNFLPTQETGSGAFLRDDEGKFSFETNAKFKYQYYDYQTKQMTAEIVNAGLYKVICQSIQDSTKQTLVDVVIAKHKLSFVANLYNYIEYGDFLPKGLININDVPEDFLSQTEIGQEFKGIGRDEDVVIGRKVDVTNANVGSNVSSYKTDVYFELKDEFKQNYQTTANVTQTSLSVIKKKVVLVVDDQNLTYGQQAINGKYKMYSYKNYTSTGEDLVNLLNDTKVDYASNIYLGSPNYKIVSVDQNDNVVYTNASLNDAGVLDVLFAEDGETVLSYDMFYESAVSRGNVEIAQVISGKIKVNQREVKILPLANQFKNYSQKDPETINYDVITGSFLNSERIINFLNIDYDINLDDSNAGNDDFDANNPNYKYNFAAPVGKYFYKVDNTLNKNYKIELDAQAINDASGAEDSSKIKFEVKPCDIYVEFAEVVDYYKTPNGNEVHTLSYYSKTNSNESGITPNYKTSFKSLKINGVEYVTKTENGYVLDDLIKDEAFENNGKFYVVINKTPKSSTPTYQKIGGFYVLLNLNKIEYSEDCFASYYVAPAMYTIDGISSVNYKFDCFARTKLKLNKIPLKIIPTLNEGLMSKTYDATENIQPNFGYLVGAANTDVYFTLSDNTIDLNEVLSVAQILTLSFKETSGGDNKYIKINDDGTEEVVDTMKNVGKYKIMLSDLSGMANGGFNEGKEYYEISIDTSKSYYYTVKPRALTIVPSANQNKVYGSYDSDLRYTILNMAEASTTSPEDADTNPVTIDGYQITGALSREIGESVGNYKIKLGNINFGANFTLTLSETPVSFEIKKRDVKIKPIEYSIVYGENYPTQIGYEKEIVKTNASEILNLDVIKDGPTISGQFTINGVKIGNYYPVKIVNGKVEGYQILQGTAVSTSDNYNIIFDDTSLFTVNKRPIILNIKAQTKTLTDVIVTNNIFIDSQYYQVSNLVDGATTSLSVNLQNKSNIYQVESFSLNITKNSSNLNYCYEVTLGKDVVYNIDVAMVYLKITDTKLLGSTTEVVYNGEGRDNEYKYNEDQFKLYNPDFSLVSESELFTIEKETNFKFKYYTIINGKQEEIDKPKDVGSYTAVIDLGSKDDNFKIVIKNNALNQVVTFDTLEDNVVDNYALSVSNVGYLNITKANITVVDSTSLKFVDAVQYSTSDLSNIMENDYANNKIIFQGVGNDRIVLKKFGSLNFKTSVKPEEIMSYKANSEYIINVQVEAAKLNGSVVELDGSGNQISNKNYNPLYIDVRLKVAPRNIVYTKAEIISKETYPFVYNGRSKSFNISLMTQNADGEEEEIKSDKIVYSYEYIRLSTVYKESALGDFEYRNYDEYKDTVGSTIESRPLSTLSANKYAKRTINGVNYIIVNNEYAILISDNQEEVPKSAGIYICIITCQTDSNHTFALDESGVVSQKGQNVSFGFIYEIEKSQSISVQWLKEKFYYTTVFDFDNPETLPFEYDATAEVKNDIQFKLEGDIDIPVNNMLYVGDYNVSLKVDTKNYYFKKIFKFSVINLPAIIIVPVNSTYIHTGSVINSFLTNIGATLNNKDGEALNTVYWSSKNEEFTFKFNQILEDGTELHLTDKVDEAPSAVGNYVLDINYQSKEGNFGGEGRYYYSIIKKSYNGAISFLDTTITYNPNITQQEFYDLILSRMFNIGVDSGTYEIDLRYDETTTSGASIPFADKPQITRGDADGNEVIAEFKKYNSAGQKNVYIQVSFKDGITATLTLKAILNIQRYTLEASDFNYISNTTNYEYSGYQIYHALKYKDIDMSPKPNATENGTYENYSFSIANELVVITDRLGSELFTLEYKYNRQFTETGALQEMSSYPVVPNDAEDQKNIYRVSYNFRFGTNYSGRNISYSYMNYTISKADVLVVSYENDTLYYTGEGLSEYEPATLKVANNKFTTVSNMKYTICYDSSSGSVSDIYREDKGVYLLLYITKNDGTQKVNVSNVIEKGEYQVNMTLYYGGSYKIEDFFESIEFGAVSKTAAAFVSYLNDDHTEYGYFYSKKMTIKPIKVTYSNYTSLISISNIIRTSASGLVLSSSSSVLSLVSSNNLSVSIQVKVSDTSWEDVATSVVNGYNFSDLDKEKTYCFVLLDDNHSEGKIVFTFE